MKRKTKLLYFFTFCIPLVWAGIVIGISFLEAPLKFNAPGVTLEVGTGIGQIVFRAMKKLEWLLLLAWMAAILWSRLYAYPGTLILILALMFVQTFVLLPLLDARIELLRQGIQPPPSFLHVFYISFEVMKLAALIVAAFYAFGRIIQSFAGDEIRDAQVPIMKASFFASSPSCRSS